MVLTGKKKDIYKIIRAALGVLLCVVATALICTMIYNFLNKQAATSVIPDNIISPDKASFKDRKALPLNLLLGSTKPAAGGHLVSALSAKESARQTKAESFVLHNKKPTDNTPFKAENLFPGDTLTRDYCVKVSYQNTITVRFRTDIRQGGEKLSEVLKCKVDLPATGETMYDGLIKDMPESLNLTLTSAITETSEVDYRITAYLDNSVGNEYQEKTLTADFVWWVEETENLRPVNDYTDVGTGGYLNPFNLIGLAAALFALGILLVLHRKGVVR